MAQAYAEDSKLILKREIQKKVVIIDELLASLRESKSRYKDYKSNMGEIVLELKKEFLI